MTRSLALSGVAGAELFEDVVQVGEGELRVLGLLAFAVGVEALGEVADVLFAALRSRGNGKGSKQSVLL